jgi:hypothetical protein
MSPSTPPPDSAQQPPDGVFALVAGCYAAAVLSPVGVALAGRVVDGPAAGYGAFLAAATVAIVGGALLIRRQAGLAVRLGARRRAWLLPLGPLVATALVFTARWTVAAPLVTRGDALLALAGGAGAATVGFVLVSMAKTRYVAWLLEDVPVEASWRAGWPPGPRRRLQYVAGVLVAVGVLVLAIGIVLDQPAARIIGQIVLPLGALLATVGGETTYRITPRGLEVREPVSRRLIPWSAIEGYELDARALVLDRGSRFRVSIRSDVTAIEDREAVIDALDAHLPRLA